MHKYFIDTEFSERFHHPMFSRPYHTIDLISIAIVDENNREYHAVSSDFNPALCNKWVQENVLKKIVEDFVSHTSGDERNNVLDMLDERTIISQTRIVQKLIGKPNDEIALEIIDFMNPNTPRFSHQKGKFYLGQPILYGYYSAYDHVLLASLFGTMEHLPKFFPFYTRDIQQMIDDNGIDKEKLLADIPQEKEHLVYEDARWNKKAYEYIINLKK